MEVNVHHAKTNLSKLIAAAEDGEEVIIARNGKAAVRLVPVQATSKRSRREMWGSGIGKIWISDDFDAPEANAEVAMLMEGGKDYE
jgi:prevent-host-death family protein